MFPADIKPASAPRSSELHASAAMSEIVSPRGDPSLLCKYKSGKCMNRRATKRNGQLHTLCHFHRVRQNEHQRKSDRKHRMVNVARKAKLGSLSAILNSERRGRRSPPSSACASAACTSDGAQWSPSRRVSSTETSLQRTQYASSLSPSIASIRSAPSLQSSFASSSHAMASSEQPVHWRSNLTRLVKQSDAILPAQVASPLSIADVMSTPPSMTPMGTGSGRLPPISFLTQQSKLESFRSSVRPASTAFFSPPPSSSVSGSMPGAPEASKTA